MTPTPALRKAGRRTRKAAVEVPSGSSDAIAPLLAKQGALLSDPWAFGPACFVIDEVVTLFEPIEGVRGMLGWWPLPSLVQTRIADATGRRPIYGWSLQQPFATAISGFFRISPYGDPGLDASTDAMEYAAHGPPLVPGPKRIENRPKAIRIGPGGVWLALHASQAPYPGGEAMVREVWPELPAMADLPRGAILAAIHVADCVEHPDAAMLAAFRRGDGFDVLARRYGVAVEVVEDYVRRRMAAEEGR